MKFVCNLDVLGVKEDHSTRDEIEYDKFKKIFSQNPDGRYQRNLYWKEKHRLLIQINLEVRID